jgi:hypothetical protein
VNLIEAVKSGKPFKRPHWEYYVALSIANDLYVYEDSGSVFRVDSRDLFNEDYELKPESKPRNLAWIDDNGRVYFIEEGKVGLFFNHKRAPWLDEPEVKK